MKSLYVLCTSFVFVGLLSPLLTLSARAAEPPPGIFFSEVDWGGSLRNSSDEWLELANLGGSPIDLSGWNITGAGTSSTNLTLPQGSTIPAYSTFLIANYAPSDVSTLVNQADYVTTAISLPNTKLTLSLLDTSDLVVDSLVDAGTPDYGSTTPIFSSMERNLATLTWQNPSSSINLIDATQLGSPGFVQPVVAAPLTTTGPIPDPALIVEPVIAPIPEPIINTLVSPEPVVTESITTSPEYPPPAMEGPADVLPAEPTPDFIITDTLTPMPVVTDPILIPEPVVLTEPSAASTDIIVIPTDPIITIEVQAIPPELIVDTPATDQNSIVEASTITETPILTTTEPIIDSAPIVAAPIAEPISEPILETIVTTPILDSPVIAEPSITPIIPESITESTTPPLSQPATQPSLMPLVLNEFLPSPSTGFDEWVEVYNPNPVDVELSGYSITDASGQVTAFTDTILAGGYQTILNPSGKLNNDGDTLNLFDASGQLVDTVSYGTSFLAAPKHDASLSRTGDAWLLSTTPTPGSSNSIISEVSPAVEPPVIVELSQSSTLTTSALSGDTNPITNQSGTAVKLAPVTTTSINASSTTKQITAPKLTVTKTSVTKVATKATTKKKSTKVSKAPQLITTLTGVADNILVTYQGTIIATPGTFGKQIAFINGATLYMDNADWPALALGDIITITGITSTANGEQRIKLSNASAITITGNAELTSSTDLSASTEPSLITVHGTVVTRNGSKLTLKVDGHDVIIDAYKTTGIIWSSLTSSELTITGILRHLGNEDVLMPRTTADVVEDHSAAISAAANTKHSTPIPLKPLAGGGLVASSLGAFGYWFTKSRTLIPSV